MIWLGHELLLLISGLGLELRMFSIYIFRRIFKVEKKNNLLKEVRSQSFVNLIIGLILVLFVAFGIYEIFG